MGFHLQDLEDPEDPVDLEVLVRPERLVDQGFLAVLVVQVVQVVQVVLEYPEILLILKYPVGLVSLQFRL
ncbi:hypothetical protein [Paenibacillus sp. GM2FR]|uniref:hypothetical protein n=1 Tax=Paenibacillus sp. GM2FR TaxID=2059268 RepID=UPI000C26F788|nr:hypothetical protein [Paenibacillus sp. GM2FR]